MRSTFFLIKDVRQELVKAFADKPYRAAGTSEGYRPPNILIGHVPPKQQSRPTNVEKEFDNTASEPPFVLVRAIDGGYKFDGNRAWVHEVKVGILCCVYSQEAYSDIQAGYEDIMNMTETALMTLNDKLFWADNLWRLAQNLPWTSGLEKAFGVYEAGIQDHPYYGSAITATFTAAAPAFASMNDGIGFTGTMEVRK